ncbi:hypothetical protein EXN66_Car021750 [Channa argus]|uniref:Uncharacterized protein n=1 Tax=Channa argus TaxID=215402 RepID=A0A6G1QUR7_CHAAH|nr:hypothetical protein EXN66_Car021750 [Channa argus]
MLGAAPRFSVCPYCPLEGEWNIQCERDAVYSKAGRWSGYNLCKASNHPKCKRNYHLSRTSVPVTSDNPQNSMSFFSPVEFKFC